MKKGAEAVINNVQGYDASDPVVVSDPTQDRLQDINYTPSQSYPFNIYWKIVGKKIIKLQPGATHVHTFKFKPKSLWNRGYLGYRYLDSEIATSGNKMRMGIKDFTCGSLFKFWGQTAAEADSGIATVGGSAYYVQDHSHATTLSGRIAIKSYQTYKYYCIDDKYTYHFSGHGSWRPDDEETLPLPTVTQISHPEDDQMSDDSGEPD